MSTPASPSTIASRIGLAVFIVASIAAWIPAQALSSYVLSLASDAPAVAASIGPVFAGLSAAVVSVLVMLVLVGFLHFTNQILAVEGRMSFGAFLGYCGYGRLFTLASAFVSYPVTRAAFTTKMPMLDLAREMARLPATRIVGAAGSVLLAGFCLAVNAKVRRAPLRAIAIQAAIIVVVGVLWFLFAQRAR